MTSSRAITVFNNLAVHIAYLRSSLVFLGVDPGAGSLGVLDAGGFYLVNEGLQFSLPGPQLCLVFKHVPISHYAAGHPAAPEDRRDQCRVQS